MAYDAKLAKLESEVSRLKKDIEQVTSVHLSTQRELDVVNQNNEELRISSVKTEEQVASLKSKKAQVCVTYFCCDRRDSCNGRACFTGNITIILNMIHQRKKSTFYAFGNHVSCRLYYRPLLFSAPPMGCLVKYNFV